MMGMGPLEMVTAMKNGIGGTLGFLLAAALNGWSRHHPRQMMEVSRRGGTYRAYAPAAAAGLLLT